MPVAQCTCGKSAAKPVGDGIVRVSRETGGRGGKAVTVIRGLALDSAGLAKLGRELKAACGTGGTAKEGSIELQGDKCDAAIAILAKQGWIVKRAGG
jgi:translation initiation factor 1